MTSSADARHLDDLGHDLKLSIVRIRAASFDVDVEDALEPLHPAHEDRAALRRLYPPETRGESEPELEAALAATREPGVCGAEGPVR